jgi:hypothetical protein
VGREENMRDSRREKEEGRDDNEEYTFYEGMLEEGM